jgi:hypothetical protein
MPRKSEQALAKKKVTDREYQKQKRIMKAEKKKGAAEKKKEYDRNYHRDRKEATDTVGELPFFGDAGTFDSPDATDATNVATAETIDIPSTMKKLIGQDWDTLKTP